MPTATQVAEWIVRHSAEDLDAPVDPMSLEKLVYYAQCVYLALNRKPLFNDEIRAWRFGPVVRTVYDRYASFDANPIVLEKSDWPNFEDSIEQHLEEIVSFFGAYTGLKLSSATHEEGPWIKARKGLGRRDNSDVLMPVPELRQYYCALIYDGEEALSKQELLDVAPEPRWGTFYVAGICARRMMAHPFYDISLAKRLAEPTPTVPNLGEDFYAPIRDKEMLNLGDVSDLTPEQIAELVTDAISSPPSKDTK